MNVTIAEDLLQFVQDEVQSGRFPSESAMVEEALRLLKHTKKDNERNGVATVLESIDSNGLPKPFKVIGDDLVSTDRRSIGRIIDEIMSDLSEEELDQLPVDGSVQHDHYIYGTPKRPV